MHLQFDFADVLRATRPASAQAAQERARRASALLSLCHTQMNRRSIIALKRIERQALRHTLQLQLPGRALEIMAEVA